MTSAEHHIQAATDAVGAGLPDLLARNDATRPFEESDLAGMLSTVDRGHRLPEPRELATLLRVAATTVRQVAAVQENRPVPLRVADLAVVMAAAEDVLASVGEVFAGLAADGQSWAVLPSNQPGALVWNGEAPVVDMGPDRQLDRGADTDANRGHLVAELRSRFSEVGDDLDISTTHAVELRALLGVVAQVAPPTGGGERP